MLEKMKSLIRSQHVCVLATVSGGQPHCSLMSYVADDDCRELYMVTFRNTRKYRNLRDNPAISLLVDSREDDRGEKRSQASALTISGRFEEVSDSAKRDRIRQQLLQRHPHLNVLTEDPEAAFFAVRIRSLQLLEGVEEAHFVTME